MRYVWDYFISFNKEHEACAIEAAEVLRAYSYKVWLQTYESRKGGNIDSMIQKGIKGSQHFIALLGSRYENGAWTKEELEYFKQDRRERGRERLIHVLECEAIEPVDLALKKVYRGRLFDKKTKKDRQDEVIATVRHRTAGTPSSEGIPFEDVPAVAPWCVDRQELGEITAQFFPEGSNTARSGGASQVPRPRRILIQAGPGFGKTTLAAQYAEHAHKSALFQGGIWWFAAQEASKLLITIAKTFLRSEVPGTATVLERARAGLKDKFGSASVSFLLIFDNVTSFVEATGATFVTAGERSAGTEKLVRELAELLPGNVRVLMTARRAGWDSDAYVIKLGALPTEAAAAALRAHADRPNDVHDSLRLAHDLGGLPLSVGHAGQYCRNTGLSFRGYRERYRNALTGSAKEFNEYVAKAPADAKYSHSLYATVRLSLKRARKRRLGGKAATKLADFLSYCASGGIPRSLYEQAIDDTTALNAAVKALRDVALIEDDTAYDGDSALKMHRLVQLIVRTETDKRGRSPAVIGRLIPFLRQQLKADAADGSDGAGDRDSQFKKYFPHLLEALPHLDAPDFRGNVQKDLLDDTAKLVVLALAEQEAAGETGEAIPPHLPGLLGCFYELEPLSKPLDALLGRIHRHAEDKAKAWATFRDDCLKQGNYVLRVALAEALARAVQAKPPLFEETEVTKLVDPERNDLNRFELGGYALKAVYSERADPERMRIDLLQRLAEHRCYPGRSILGDLMLNLAYQNRPPSDILSGKDDDSHPFWNPSWDFIAYDVNAIRAAEYVQEKMAPGPDASPEVAEEYEFLLQMDKWCEELLRDLPGTSGVRAVVRDFFKIGTKQERISEASASFAELRGTGHLVRALRLLFAHPLWSVGETTAGVIAGLIRDAADQERHEEAQVYRDAIQTLLAAHEPWRVRLAAMETAYQFRHEDDPRKGRMGTFSEGIRRFYADPSSKLRGLCAENLVSVMLNASDRGRRTLERRFRREIRFWLRDEDCWVLEHVHRYFYALHLRGGDVSRLIGGRFARLLGLTRVSRLFEELDDWWKKDRETFLRHIEKRKAKIGKEKKGARERDAFQAIGKLAT